MSGFEKVLLQIDSYNQNDPKKELFEGQNQASEVVYSLRVTKWVKELLENPSNEMLIAARGAHIGRWEVPRNSYPEGLPGYHQWKTFLLKFHAQKVAAIMESNGYAPEIIEKVSAIILRKKIKENPEAQALEDAVSLLFLEIQLLPLMAKATEEKVINAITKTWAKMSAAGQAKALQLQLPPEAVSVIKKALVSQSSQSTQRRKDF